MSSTINNTEWKKEFRNRLVGDIRAGSLNPDQRVLNVEIEAVEEFISSLLTNKIKEIVNKISSREWAENDPETIERLKKELIE